MSASTRLIFGFHAILAKLRHDAAGVHEIYVDASRNDARLRDLVRQADFAGMRVLPVEAQRLAAMAPAARHQGVIATIAANQRHVTLDDVLDTLEEPPFLLVLDGIQDPHNLGACLRVADAVGAHAVVAPKDRATGLTQTAIKVASGAAETVPYITVTNLARALRQLQTRDVWIIGAAAETGEPLYSAQWPSACAWVLGAEGDGLRRLTRETCDQLISIPMLGTVASLNVSVAAGVCLYEARRRRDSGGSAAAGEPLPRQT
ncbi:MAG TPA: 23S rRNA (guanosine(2251)-2'-O)-methyltransferase RlmB [Accumulibacter sp.]|uniref:23S rRNA (guanosine(2251)-2'-O)-methyltransferase RlmB n=1 Tax=Accumulibacter sp. TaxID=2053492 RepID=UPI002B673242|nr:23S rRNA (guanosine(2251)-2'-O)-methyltransferase RlmB [Accumulibacter sp.]HNI51520.1 23S rRNA (guanosine(2251)-2'-O)-methyltransferase RlmB [Accumulibacter sp.]HNL97613.1 23S rRNA (guanosine(2251)-2'-O)-methyltransferase RlmB [Accumulibacter sp.]